MGDEPVFNLQNKISIVNELGRDYEFAVAKLKESKNDRDAGEIRLARLKTLRTEFVTLLSKTREAGEKLSEDDNDEIKKKIAAMMTIAQPNASHVEPANTPASKDVNLAFHAVRDAIEAQSEFLKRIRLSIEHEERSVLEQKVELLNELYVFSNLVSQFVDNVHNLVTQT